MSMYLLFVIDFISYTLKSYSIYAFLFSILVLDTTNEIPPELIITGNLEELTFYLSHLIII